MKIALLSDIHSNIDAFNAVLKFIEQKKINTGERRRLGEDFLDAVYKNNSLFVKDIYNQGVDVDYKDKHGTNALLISSFKSYTEICKYLIQVAKVNVNARNKDGTTALHNVCENGNEEIVKLLMITSHISRIIGSKVKYLL